MSVLKVPDECKLVGGDGKDAADLGLASVTVPDSSPFFNGVVLVERWWRSGQDLQLLSCWMRNGVGGEADTERALVGGVTSSLTSALEYLPK